MRRVAQKKKCLQHRALIVAWLRVNYCLRESGSIAKCEVFLHYTELCQANKIEPSSAAAFGKILKMAFPTVKCNRVGPRGASKHHYRGLVLKGAYQLSLADVEPLSEAAITQLMKEEAEAEAASNARRGKISGGRRRRGAGEDDEDYDDDEEEDDEDGGDDGSQQGDRRTMMMVSSKTEPSASTATASPTPRQALPSSPSPTSPHPSSPMSRPAPHHQHHPHHPYALQHPPLDHLTQLHSFPGAGYVGGYTLQPPQPTAYLLPPPHPPPHYQAPVTKESFSWISPDMDYAARRPVPSAPLAAQVPAQVVQSPAVNDAALREWAEKRDLVEFCERTFQALYDNVHRTLSSDGGGGGHEFREQVLTRIAEAWKNLRQYTRHMHLFPEPTSSTSPTAPMSTTTTASAERTTDGRAPTSPPMHHQPPPPPQPQPLPPPDVMNTTAPPFSHFTMVQLPPAYYARAGTPPPLTFAASGGGGSGGRGSSLSLSWLANSLTMSMGGTSSHQRATTPTPPAPPNASDAYHHPQQQRPPGPSRNGGDGEGSPRPDRGNLEFRSFEWKGVYE